MEIVFFIFVFAALYPYIVFPAILWVWSIVLGKADPARPAKVEAASIPPCTIIVLAHNEEARVAAKVRESIPALEANPQNALLIVSDHSSDRTVEVASAIGHRQVQVVENRLARGRALASNFAVGLAKHEFLIFTDAETQVPAQTFSTMIATLSRKGVGCVNAEIVFRRKGDDNVSDAAGMYWRFEMALRALETQLGLYATASGPCMAVRRSLFRDLSATGDVDFTTPLDVIEQGYRCMHLSGCVAFDVMPADPAAEFKVRTRQVAKNLSGTISRWGTRNVVRHPLYSWALYSHKIMRWLVPFFLIGVFLSNLVIVNRHWIFDLTFILQIAFYLMAVAGWVGYRKKQSWRIVQTVYAFVLANAAFLVGILKAVARRVPSHYVPTGHLRK